MRMHLSRIKVLPWGARSAWAAAAVAGAIAVLPSDPARAADGKPGLSGALSFEFHDDWAVRSDDPDAERNDVYGKVEADLEAALTRSFSIKSHLTLEPVFDPEPGRSRFFDDEGLYAEELYAEYHADDYAVRAGKFDPAFGIAWDAAPGIWGTDLAEEYQLTEQIGLGGEVAFGGDGYGTHVVAASTFFADTTFLSESLITNRGRLRHSDGGAGNTEDLSSWAVSLTGSDVPVLAGIGLAGIGYHIGWEHRATDVPGGEAENGLAAALTTTIPIGAVELAPLIEYVALSDRDGVPGADVHYLTTSALLTYSQWSLALSRTGRTSDASGGPDATLAQISAGYTFVNGVGVHAGYRYFEEAGVETDIVGVLVDYAMAF